MTTARWCVGMCLIGSLAVLGPSLVCAQATTSAAEPAEAADAKMPDPLSPAEALERFQVDPGLRVELAASEPLLADPVAFDWGPDGRLWVVEMGDYPSGVPGVARGGRIKVLTDRDGDWRYDAAEVFLEGLSFPTGLKVWRDGVLITAAPDILFARDTDGDGRADAVETLFTGFKEGNQQHRVNGLRWGLDGWLYVANGESGGNVRFTPVGSAEATVVNLGSRDARLDPDRRLLQTVTGGTQFGRNRNDWGDWFGGHNSEPLWHYVLSEELLRRNRFVAPPPLRHPVLEMPGASPVFPISRTLPRFNDLDRANRFTSACSHMIYRDDWLGPEYQGNALICEPVHNLVRREILSAQGATFRSRSAWPDREFLASPDNWFRPVMIRTGPDGALWVADMYRLVIEHPEWIPRTWQDRLNLRAGDDRGRLYRIVRSTAAPRGEAWPSRLPPAQWVELLGHPNGWRRDMAHQLLFQLARRDPAVAVDAAVAAIVRPALGDPRVLARLHALCLLGSWETLKEEELLAALADEHSQVRRWAAYWLGKLLQRDSHPPSAAVAAALCQAAEDPDPQARLEAAAILGQLPQPQAVDALARYLASNDDPYLRTAGLCALTPENAEAVARQVLQGSTSPELLTPLLRTVASLTDGSLLKRLAGQLLESTSLAPPLSDVMRQRLQTLTALLGAAAGRSEAVADALRPTLADHWRRLQREAAHLLAEDEVDHAWRQTIIAWTATLPEMETPLLDALARHLHPQFSDQIQHAAVQALARQNSSAAAEALMQDWPQAAPALREQMQVSLLSRPAWARLLMEAAQHQRVSSVLWSARTRELALHHSDAEVRRQAAAVWGAVASDARDQVLEQARAALMLPAEASRGSQVFSKRCAGCHALDGVGHALGPDLAALTDRSPHALLTAILAPNRAVEDRFQDYAVALVDGRRLSGLLLEESPSAITLGAQDGKRQVVLRSDIEELHATGRSLMPEGLEKDLPLQELADLLAYLRGGGPSPKSFPGNQPATPAHPIAADGDHLDLLASRARVYGPNLMYEPAHQNLGFWRHPDDQAAWSLVAPQAGAYQVRVRFACDPSCSGSLLRVSIAGQELTWKVPATADWDDYQEAELGRVTLPLGPADLLLQPAGEIGEFLVDLHSIQLLRLPP